MFITQSAMSHALNRLRDLLDDPILVRTSEGMKPTPRAKSMKLQVREGFTRNTTSRGRAQTLSSFYQQTSVYY